MVNKKERFSYFCEFSVETVLLRLYWLWDGSLFFAGEPLLIKRITDGFWLTRKRRARYQ